MAFMLSPGSNQWPYRDARFNGRADIEPATGPVSTSATAGKPVDQARFACTVSGIAGRCLLTLAWSSRTNSGCINA